MSASSSVRPLFMSTGMRALINPSRPGSTENYFVGDLLECDSGRVYCGDQGQSHTRV